jgi:hypothetical protein
LKISLTKQHRRILDGEEEWSCAGVVEGDVEGPYMAQGTTHYVSIFSSTKKLNRCKQPFMAVVPNIFSHLFSSFLGRFLTGHI